MKNSASFDESDEDSSRRHPGLVLTGIDTTINHKSFLEHEIQKEIQYMKDLILGTLYDNQTKCLDLAKISSTEIYDQIFFNSLSDLVSNDNIKIKHIICCSSNEKEISASQLTNLLAVFKDSLPRIPIQKTLDFSGNKKLTASMAKSFSRLIRWKKNVDLRSISENNTQIIVLDCMKISKTENLQYLFGKNYYKEAWINYISELSLESMEINDDALCSLDEDGTNFFRSMPMLKFLNLSNNKISLRGALWLAKGILVNESIFLHKLNLYGNELSNKGIKLLMHALSNCKQLKHLNIGNNNIDDGGINDITSLIDPSSPSFIKLRVLLLSSNRLTSVGCSKLMSCLTKKLQSKTKSKKPLLHSLDISSNSTDISLLNSLRSLLESSKDLRFLSLSHLHKLTSSSQSIIISSFAKNKSLTHLDLKVTSEEFYYNLRNKLDLREEGFPQVKISFTKFVQENGSSGKKDKENETENLQEKINDYSARVREINREKTKRYSRKKEMEEKKAMEKERERENEEIHVQEEVEISELTEEIETSYMKVKGRKKEKERSFGVKREEKAKNEIEELEYSDSDTSEDKIFESNISETSSDFYYAKSTSFKPALFSNTTLTSDFNSSRLKLEDEINKSTGRSTISSNKETEGLVNNYKKLLTDIRGVIKEQRENILKKKNYLFYQDQDDLSDD